MIVLEELNERMGINSPQLLTRGALEHFGKGVPIALEHGIPVRLVLANQRRSKTPERLV